LRSASPIEGEERVADEVGEDMLGDGVYWSLRTHARHIVGHSASVSIVEHTTISLGNVPMMFHSGYKQAKSTDFL